MTWRDSIICGIWMILLDGEVHLMQKPLTSGAYNQGGRWRMLLQDVCYEVRDVVKGDNDR